MLAAQSACVIHKHHVEQPEFKGAHLLRHSLLTSMLRCGATIGEIGANTTEIYAKVDFDGLRSLAHSWPMEGAQGSDWNRH
jgi:site-specific recombinase XerD